MGKGKFSLENACSQCVRAILACTNNADDARNYAQQGCAMQQGSNLKRGFYRSHAKVFP